MSGTGPPPGGAVAQPPPFTVADVQAELSPVFFERGRGYHRAGRVLECRRRRVRGRQVVSGRVQGSRGAPYSVRAELEPRPGGGWYVEGTCSCPVSFDCKHVVALLLAAVEDASAVLEDGGDAQALTAWAERLELAARKAPGPAAQTARRLFYVVAFTGGAGEVPRLAVAVLIASALRSGGVDNVEEGDLERLLRARGRYVQASDRPILRLLAGAPAMEGAVRLLGGDTGALALGAMLATGRCHLNDPDLPPLRAGDPRPAEWHWARGRDGWQRLTLEVVPPAVALADLTPAYYLDPAAGTAGPVSHTVRRAVADVLREAPALPPGVAPPPPFLGALAAAGLPAPDARLPRRVVVAPRPCLALVPGGVEDDADPIPEWVDFTGAMPPAARLTFDYDGAELPYDPTEPPVTVAAGAHGGPVEVVRDPVAEGAYLDELADRHLVPGVWLHPRDDAVFPLVFDDRETGVGEAGGWLGFVRDGVPALQARGWRVRIDPGFEYRVAATSEWYAEAAASGEGGWFDLELGVLVDGERYPIVPLLRELLEIGGAEVLRRGEKLEEDPAVRMPDGSWLFLPAARVQRILETLVELGDPHAGAAVDRLRLSEWRAPDLQALFGDGTHQDEAPWAWRAPDALDALATRIRRFGGIEPLDPAPGFRAELRPYQREGLGWLQYLTHFGFGGILADDMGLGKTVQTLAHLHLEHVAGGLDWPSLVVAPTSLVHNWAHEARVFAPDLRVLVLHGPGRKRHLPAVADHHVVITSYALVPRDLESLQAVAWHLVVLDEAQNVKNPRTKLARAVRGLDARARLGLTGTPLENHLGELWSLYDFLQPGLLGDARQFRRLFRTPVEKHEDAGRERLLQRRVAPFLLRRTKGDVLPELPPKTEIERIVELTEGQRDLYETIRAAMDRKVRSVVAAKGFGSSQIEILDALLKLRQVCCDPRLVKLPSAARAGRSAKLDLLMTLLPELVAGGRRILVFSQFTEMLALIEQALGDEGIAYEKLTGSTRDRAAPVRRFQGGASPVFLISLKAGGTGLNLTAADTVIHYDPWWNPAAEDQATDRAHRIGQDSKVFVYRLVTAGTVESRMLALQARKRRLAESVYAGAQTRGGLAVGPEDLAALLTPLEDAVADGE